MPYFKPNKILRNIRKTTDPRDYGEEPFRVPDPGPYRHGAEANRPSEPARTSIELLLRSKQRGFDPLPVLEFAVWSAVLLWSRPLKSKQSSQAVLAHRLQSLASISGTSSDVITDIERKLADECREAWKRAGSPLHAEYMQRAQRVVEREAKRREAARS